MIDLKSAEKAEELTLDLLRKGIFVRWLRAFGLPSCIRVSVGLPGENEHFVATLRSIWK
jgi:histidinol-phosphate aminotransferase